MSAAPGELVFGYASLMRDFAPAAAGDGAPRIGHLAGYRRAWNVAMDNSVDLPGYKCYRRPDGERPAVFVAFLNIVQAPGERINGVLFPASAAELDALDARERNYRRIEVSAAVEPRAAARVWAYAGTDAARERFETGMRAGRAVVSAEYRDRVRRGFAALGTGLLDEFAATTDDPPCPVVELEPVALPPA